MQSFANKSCDDALFILSHYTISCLKRVVMKFTISKYCLCTFFNRIYKYVTKKQQVILLGLFITSRQHTSQQESTFFMNIKLFKLINIKDMRTLKFTFTMKNY